jgi:molybdopterin synthase sulfur carrier subunit
LRELLASRGGVWSEVFAEDRPVLAAVNQEMATAEQVLQLDDEVGFFPPVTGG